MYIDTHTHIYADAFAEDRREMLERAFSAGVGCLLMPNIDSSSISGMEELELKYPGKCLAMMGLHPCSVKENWQEELEMIRRKLFSRKYIAVGEIGIDLYWDKSFLKDQQEVFGMQIEWAKELNLPIVIHARDSFPEIFEVLDQHNDERLKGVFHCFTGGVEEIAKIRLYSNFYFGIGGVVTFKKSGLDEVVSHLELNEILLETDSPYLAPMPFRGKRNESAYLPHIAEKISDIFHCSLKDIGQITSENAKKCFSLMK